MYARLFKDSLSAHVRLFGSLESLWLVLFFYEVLFNFFKHVSIPTHPSTAQLVSQNKTKHDIFFSNF